MAIKKYAKGEIVKLKDATDKYVQYIGQEVTIDFVGSVGYMVIAKDGKRFAIDVTCIEGWEATQEPLRTTKKAAPKSTDFEYSEGEVVLVRSYKYSSVHKSFQGKQAIITYIKRTGTAKFNTVYSLRFEDGKTTTAFVDEIRPFPAKSAPFVAESGVIPVKVDNVPVSNNGTQTIFIDGMPYVVAAWGEELTEGYRTVIVRAA